ncbi:hypothetical protein GCM10029978_111510 [Actinoallomurus acanthiterrae]
MPVAALFADDGDRLPQHQVRLVGPGQVGVARRQGPAVSAASATLRTSPAASANSAVPIWSPISPRNNRSTPRNLAASTCSEPAMVQAGATCSATICGLKL